jgi:heme exporter protein A
MATFGGTALTCIRAERIVFRNLSFALASGALIELRGANGSGKSSLLRILAGLMPPAEGRLTWNDAPLGEDRDAHRARVNYLGHLDGVKGALTVEENLRFWMQLRGGSREQLLRQALASFQLEKLAVRPARSLSQGQRRRVALARLVACPATVWLLDEPASALDTAGAAALDHVIAAHLGTGGMVAMATHEKLRHAAVLDLDGFK